MRLIKQALDEN